MAGRRFDPENLQQGFENLMGKAAEVLSKGREELLKQAKAGKVKLIDLTQLRRERARLLQMLGEEVFRQLKSGKLEKEELSRTYRKITEMDAEIASKEAEVDRIQRDDPAPARKPESAPPEPSSAPSSAAGGSAPGSTPKKGDTGTSPRGASAQKAGKGARKKSLGTEPEE